MSVRQTGLHLEVLFDNPTVEVDGNISGSCVLSGTVTAAGGVAGGITGTCTLSGTIRAAENIEGNISGSCTLSGTVMGLDTIAAARGLELHLPRGAAWNRRYK